MNKREYLGMIWKSCFVFFLLINGTSRSLNGEKSFVKK